MRFDSDLLRQTRLDLGLTQEQAARSLGIDARTYRRYESGAVNAKGFSVRDPRRRRLLAEMSREFGIDERDLVRPDEARESTESRPGPAPVSVASQSREQARFEPRVVHTLQPARHFAGRQELVAELSAWLTRSEPTDPAAANVMALVGMGGVGKTALMERVVRALDPGPQTGGLFVWSFFDNPRTEELLARATAYFVGGSDGDHSDPSPTLERLHEALSTGAPHLLILDGLEVVQSPGHGARAYGELEDPITRRLLTAAARGLGATRVLLTSRFALSDLNAWEGAGLRTVRIADLSRANAVEVLRKWGVRGDDSALGGIVDRVGRHALSLAVTGSYIGGFLGGDPMRVAELSLDEAARDDALARRLATVLDAYAESLAPRTRDVLVRLAAFTEGVDLDALQVVARAAPDVAGNMAGMVRSELDRELTRLGRLGLVYRTDSGLFSTHPFVRQYFQRAFPDFGDRLASSNPTPPPSALTGRPDRGTRDGKLLDRYEAILGELLRADRPYEGYLLYVRSMGGFSHLGLTVGDMIRGARVVRSFAEDGDPTRMHSELPIHLRASLAYDLGLYSSALGDVEFARRCYEAHNHLARGPGLTVMLATGLRTLAYSERLAGHLRRAHERITESLARSDALAERGDPNAPGHRLRGLALAAVIAHDLGDMTSAEELFERAHALDERPVARRALWRAAHLLDLGLAERVRADTLANLEVCRQRDWPGHGAHCHTVLGRAALLVGSPALARQHYDAAMSWVYAAGEVEMVLRCRDLQARIALAEKRPDAALQAALLGWHVARACHIGQFGPTLANLAARAALAAGRPAQALELIGPGEASESMWQRADAAHIGGLAARAAGDSAEARTYLRAAVRARRQLGHPGLLDTQRALAALAT